jgi:hypothetical protein
MRTLPDFVGRLVIWAALIWVAAILISPTDVRPAIACQPVVWLTRSLAGLAGAAAGTASAVDHGDSVSSVERGCTRVMTDYFANSAVRP